MTSGHAETMHIHMDFGGSNLVPAVSGPLTHTWSSAASQTTVVLPRDPVQKINSSSSWASVIAQGQVNLDGGWLVWGLSLLQAAAHHPGNPTGTPALSHVCHPLQVSGSVSLHSTSTAPLFPSLLPLHHTFFRRSVAPLAWAASSIT